MSRSSLRALAAFVVLALASGCAREEPLRVTIIGIDGATWRVANRLLQSGALPHFQALIESGVRGDLRSEAPLYSPPIWTTMVTGVSRKQHGIRHFRVGNARLVSARDRRVPALWTLASRHGLRSAVIGWWATYPAESIDGLVVSECEIKTCTTALAKR